MGLTDPNESQSWKTKKAFQMPSSGSLLFSAFCLWGATGGPTPAASDWDHGLLVPAAWETEANSTGVPKSAAHSGFRTMSFKIPHLDLSLVEQEAFLGLSLAGRGGGRFFFQGRGEGPGGGEQKGTTSRWPKDPTRRTQKTHNRISRKNRGPQADGPKTLGFRV